MTTAATVKACCECGSANEPRDVLCRGCGHDVFRPPEVVDTYLTCDHCGDVARESATGIFYDGDGEACATCGFPGFVRMRDAGAPWQCYDDPADRCERADCPECEEENER